MPNSELETGTVVNKAFSSLAEGWLTAIGEEERITAEADAMAREGIRKAKEAAQESKENFLGDVAAAVNAGMASLCEAKDYLSQWFETNDSKWEVLEQTREIAQPGTPILFHEEDGLKISHIAKTPDIWFSDVSYDKNSVAMGLSVNVVRRKKPVDIEVHRWDPSWGSALIGETQIKNAVTEHIKEHGAGVINEVTPVVSNLIKAGFEFEDDLMGMLKDKALGALHLYSWQSMDNMRLRIYIDTNYGSVRVIRFLKTTREYFPDVYDELVDKVAVMVATQRDFLKDYDDKMLLDSIFSVDSGNMDRLQPVEFYEKVYELAKRGQAILDDEDRLNSLVDRQG